VRCLFQCSLARELPSKAGTVHNLGVNRKSRSSYRRLRTARSNGMLVLLVTILSAATAQSVSEHPGIKGTFSAPNGDVIKLDTKPGIIVTPRSRGTGLQDCSDKIQVCLTDHHRFAFAYFRKCNDAGSGDYKRLRFRPKVVSVLHNSDIWIVFDAAPRYMFHYAYSKGIVGIYLGPTPSFDFRSVLHDQNFNLASFDAMEYRITSSDAVAACSE
jgi:hypothetical protein